MSKSSTFLQVLWNKFCHGNLHQLCTTSAMRCVKFDDSDDDDDIDDGYGDCCDFETASSSRSVDMTCLLCVSGYQQNEEKN
jgi:hypothetical protein